MIVCVTDAVEHDGGELVQHVIVCVTDAVGHDGGEPV